MNLVDSGSHTTCATHPSLIFTGFCSLCLAEKLSIVNGLERSSSRSFAVSDLGRKKPHEVQVRNTLLSLFQLEDEGKLDASIEEEEEEDFFDKNGVSTIECEADEIKPVQCGDDGRESAQTGVSFDGGSWVSESRFDSEMKASCSCSTTVENSSVDTCAVKKVDEDEGENENENEDEKSNQKGVSISSSSSWLGSVMSARKPKCKVVVALKKNPLHSSGLCCGFEERPPKMESDYRHSCDCNFPEDSTKASCSWEDPRHSWDGSVISKAFICSFSCLDGPNPLPVPESETESNMMSRRRTSRRWSKVWNWNMNSPFRNNPEPRRILERSFSESWHHQGKATVVSGRGRACGNLQQNSKNHPLSRSRSVHYSSPGGHRETGLLRFYLTPLRCTGRNSNRPRMPGTNHT